MPCAIVSILKMWLWLVRKADLLSPSKNVYTFCSTVNPGKSELNRSVSSEKSWDQLEMFMISNIAETMIFSMKLL